MENNPQSKQYDDIDAMVERYINDAHDSEAVRFLCDKALESAAMRQYIRACFEVNFSSAVATSTEKFDADNAYRRFQQRIDADTKKAKKARRLRLVRFLRAAAAVVILVALPYMGYRYATSLQPQLAANITVTTPAGSRTQVTLPDGTKVWLNAGSNITYSQSFGIADRQVRLSGEACFDVTHNEALPFTVATESASVKVLGTYFTVADYQGDSALVVDLIRGCVDLESSKTAQHQQLQPNERVVMDKATGKMVKRQIDAAHSDAWIHGEINFDEVPLEKIAKTLERTYDARIEIAAPLRNKPFYYSFNSDGTTLEQVLTTLSRTQKLKYKKIESEKSNTYLIY